MNFTKCKCTHCSCARKFQQIDKEQLLNLITHGRVSEERAVYLSSRVGSELCKDCFIGNHLKKSNLD